MPARLLVSYNQSFSNHFGVIGKFRNGGFKCDFQVIVNIRNLKIGIDNTKNQRIKRKKKGREKRREKKKWRKHMIKAGNRISETKAAKRNTQV